MENKNNEQVRTHAIVAVLNEVINNGIVKATKYISPKEIVRATRTLVHKKIQPGNIEVTLTIGKPNYLEREFIQDCKKAGEPFPVKKVQVKEYNPPKPKKNLKKK